MGHSAGEVLRASDLVDTFTSYNPTLSNWTLGNGTLNGSYFQQGSLVQVEIDYTVGSTDTPSGNLRISLPVSAATPTVAFTAIGVCTLFDTTGSARKHGWVSTADAGANLQPFDDASALVTATAPWTWATGDQVAIWATYRTA